MPNTILEDRLRESARERIRNGLLPCDQPKRVWGGRGSHNPCAVCGDVIPDHEVEYETETDLAGATVVTHFHFLCHAAWQFECAREAVIARNTAP